MKKKRFIAQIKNREEFKHVRLVESDIWTSVLMASGDIVGQPAMDALVRPRHGSRNANTRAQAE